MNSTLMLEVARQRTADQHEAARKASQRRALRKALRSQRNHAAEAYVVLADNSDTSQVARGENSGRTLSHVAVARVFSPAEHIAKNAVLNKEFRINAHSLNRNNLRLVAFLQESNHGRVLAAVMKDLSSLQ